MCCRFFFVFCCVLVTVGSSGAGSQNNFFKSRNILSIPDGMIPSLVESIASGVQMAMDHCQNVFKWDRWNCPQSSFTRRSKQLPTKETAYTKAIIAAGIVHAITRNCSRGEIKGCGCDSNLEGPSITNSTPVLNKTLQIKNATFINTQQERHWSWGGCSDDPSYAINFAKKFLNELEKGNHAIAEVGRHNSKVGREIIRDTMVKRCRCHGVSGSCSLQTCWMQVASFEVVSRKLKEKYKRATRLTYEAVENAYELGNSARDVAEGKELPGNENSLVYLEQSPDYCMSSAGEHFPGTKGRMCSRSRLDSSTISERKSCRKLCRACGHKVKKITKEITKRCNCNFIWCCEVKCDICTEVVDEYFCE